MYHETTYRELAQRRRRRIIVAAVTLAVCVVLALAGIFAARAAQQQATVSVREAVITAALQCAAVEGSYPSSLAHLEAHYGLVINHDDYLVMYEWLGDNVVPGVTVVAK